jgi:NADPH:quinone reductase
MRAIVYAKDGGLELVDRPVPEPGEGEVRVRVALSGVNPTDWKARHRTTTLDGPIVPNHDGAGIVDWVGPGVTDLLVGQRVWTWEAAYQRPDGTAQEYTVLPRRHVVPLPANASFELGASLGIPARTAHRCLTVAEAGPDRLTPGALDGRTVLVAGGAGAVGNAAIQLARWAGATVLTTVSSDEKARLAGLAGAHHVVNYRTEDAASVIQRHAPGGVDVIVEVAPAANAELNAAVTAPNATIAVYANDGGETATLTVFPLMAKNVRYQFMLIYTVPDLAKDHGIADIAAAVEAGALRVGPEAGLPLHRFPLDRAADAHAAVKASAIGKVLIEVG